MWGWNPSPIFENTARTKANSESQTNEPFSQCALHRSDETDFKNAQCLYWAALTHRHTQPALSHSYTWAHIINNLQLYCIVTPTVSHCNKQAGQDA